MNIVNCARLFDLRQLYVWYTFRLFNYQNDWPSVPRGDVCEGGLVRSRRLRWLVLAGGKRRWSRILTRLSIVFHG